MKIEKKYIIIGVVAISLIGVVVLAILFSQKQLKYPSEPLNQQSLSRDTKSISLSSTQIPDAGDFQLFQISSDTKYSAVNDFAKIFDLRLSSSEDGEYYNWSSNNGLVMYDLSKNIFVFEIKNGIEWGEAELSETSFNRFLKTYFGEDWKYEITGSEKRSGGETVYFANRYINDKNIVEVREHNQQTDMLTLKDGKIVSGKLLLTIFTPMDYKVPLVSSDVLRVSIQDSKYPKEIYPQFSSLQDNILKEVNYLSSDFDEVMESLENCSSKESSVVYYYKSFDQLLLTPVYKLDLQCDVTYDKILYSVPAVAYVNAIDSQYLSVPE